MSRTSSQTTLSFRCSFELATQARDRAESEGLDVSTALRSFLADYAAGRCTSPQIARACNRLAEAIRRVGVNVNQIARAFNAGIVDAGLSADLRRSVEQLSDDMAAAHRVVLTRKLPTRPTA